MKKILEALDKIISPPFIAAVMAGYMFYNEAYGAAGLWMAVWLICASIENHADKAKVQVFIIERKPEPEPEPGVNLKDLDFGDAWTEPECIRPKPPKPPKPRVSKWYG